MDDIAALLRSHIDSGDLPGAVALTYRGDTVETVAAGVQDLDSGVPMSGDTLFLWDSLTKPLTAALALTFVADGSLALDSPVERWLPELSSPRVLVDPSSSLARTVPAERPVRVEDLLTLRGGLGFTTDFGSAFTEALVSGLEEGPRPRSLGRGEFLTRAGGLPLAHQPGDGKFTTEMVVPGSITLLNLIDTIPENEERGFFNIGSPKTSVGRVILRLLRRVGDEAEREAFVSQILDGIETYSSQLDLIHSVGYREGAGHKLVSEAFAARIHEQFVARLQRTPPAEPWREWDAWRIYDAVQTATGEVPLASNDDPVLLRAVLHSLKSTARSQSMGSRQVRSEDRLAWEILVELFESEVTIEEAVSNVRDNLGDDNVLQLADKYLSGWRPESF